MLRGRYDEATQEFEAAVKLAPDGLAHAEIEGKLGELPCVSSRGDAQARRYRIVSNLLSANSAASCRAAGRSRC